MSLAPDAPQPRPPGPRLALSIIVIVIASAIGITGLAFTITSAVHKVRHFEDGPSGVLPATITAELTPATWQVYLQDDDADFPRFGLDAADVSVVAADGTNISVRDMPANLTETESTGRNTYNAFARFKVSTAGTYTVKVAGAPETDGVPVLVAKSFGSQFTGVLKWVAMIGIGLLLGIIGVAMVIVGIVRRSSYRRRLAYPGFVGPGPGVGYGRGFQPAAAAAQPAPVAQPGQPPPGWYDDPHLPGMQRYWDGVRWTDQTRNVS